MTTHEIIVCPICGSAIYSADDYSILMKSVIPSRSPNASAMLTEMIRESQRMVDEKRAAAEEACKKHFLERHPWRMRLWRRYQWKWPMTKRWPWSTPLKGQGDFQVPVS